MSHITDSSYEVVASDVCVQGTWFVRGQIVPRTLLKGIVPFLEATGVVRRSKEPGPIRIAPLSPMVGTVPID